MASCSSRKAWLAFDWGNGNVEEVGEVRVGGRVERGEEDVDDEEEGKGEGMGFSSSCCCCCGCDGAIVVVSCAG